LGRAKPTTSPSSRKRGEGAGPPGGWFGKKLQQRSVYGVEPSKEEVLSSLLQRYINYQLFRALVESSTAEHSARMLAMDNATKNAGEAIRKWTIIFNKARQEAITTELIDIINAAKHLSKKLRRI
jgi:ATP synthase F1 subcomplex gamma subunit 